MGDQLLELVLTLMRSPWLYALIALLALLDGVLPLVPGEAAVLVAGTYAAVDGPNLALVMLACAAGALLGDHLAYAAGRAVGVRLRSRARPGTRTHRSFQWATAATARRGGPVLVAARFLPGGRTAMTLTMGATRFPLVRFTGYDALACTVWAVYCAGVGYLGGRLFREQPVLGVAAGMGLALAVAGVFELVRRRRMRRPDAGAVPSTDGTSEMAEPPAA